MPSVLPAADGRMHVHPTQLCEASQHVPRTSRYPRGDFSRESGARPRPSDDSNDQSCPCRCRSCPPDYSSSFSMSVLAGFAPQARRADELGSRSRWSHFHQEIATEDRQWKRSSCVGCGGWDSKRGLHQDCSCWRTRQEIVCAGHRREHPEVPVVASLPLGP